ncbi:MAG: chemotaxis-specific protein-glutamate methyltransferase CheB [Bacteroidia bacterium]|nr:chemotaxis-specific protein-glutamate methyltransferase CheB [Bacteroidia bacterium]MDW8300832.1 chemotaxis-specific protein-glutamate methyltransferase CheB [Bacteroidia bacterium]
MKKIKLLLADDSGLMRLIVQDMLTQESALEVIATAENGLEALEKTQIFEPDVVLLDLVMKDYDGIFATKKIMQLCPTPIILLTSLENDHEMVFDALNAGAFDIVSKPKGAFHSKVREIKEELLQKIKIAFENKSNLKTISPDTLQNQNPHTFNTNLTYQIIVIGASTGGTTAIEHILKKMPQNLPIPIVIVQHIPAEFGKSFAKRLNQEMPFEVKIAQENEKLQAGIVYIVPSDCNMQISQNGKKIYFFEKNNQLFKEYNFPSIDSMMLSIAKVFGNKAIGIILTGMGKDGAMGMQAIHRAGGLTIAQSENTCVVFGMPKAAIELQAVQYILPLDEISQFVTMALD